jgi:hypothetical protein
MGSEDMKLALSLPTRSKIRRFTTDGDSGVLVVAKRNGDFVFKFANVDSAEEPMQTLEPKDAFEVISAKPNESARDISSEFYLNYQKVIDTFSENEHKTDSDKAIREALQKVQVIRRANVLDGEYLQDLETAIRYDAVSGYYLREINRLKKEQFTSLPEILAPEYVQDILRHYGTISLGEESIIAAEEIQNIISHPQTEIAL